jgi:hypothetical protein
MATSIPQVTGVNNIIHCLLVELTLGANVYHLSTAYKPVTYDGDTYSELGSFLQVGDLTEDIKTTNGDITLALSGIPSEADYMSQVLTAPIKGGTVKLSRAFFDTNYTYNPSNVYGRYSGVITNFSISEDEDIITGKLNNTVAITCASINTILENKVTGQRTQVPDRQKFFVGDQTFNRVPDLQNVQFDFGRDYSYSSGGGYGGGGGGYGGGGGPGGGIRFPGMMR